MNNTQHTMNALSTSSIHGTDVVNREGENLGHIEDIMIDLSTGRILYTVLSFGGFLGIGNKLFAVPFNSFTIDQANEKFVLDYDKDFLENAPGFDKNDWPATNDVDFNTEVYSYYSVDPYWTALPIR